MVYHLLSIFDDSCGAHTAIISPATLQQPPQPVVFAVALAAQQQNIMLPATRAAPPFSVLTTRYEFNSSYLLL